MRVLIVSHNVISRTGNMGKAMLSYFSAFQPEEVAQFYIHQEVPTDSTVCRNYFRFTDTDALKSLNPFRRYGTVFDASDIRERRNSRVDTGLVATVYRKAGKRSAWIFAARDLLWRVARWKTAELKAWVASFDPDILVFLSGDYAFAYRIALELMEMCQKPLAVVCTDDFYINNRNAGTAFGRLVYRRYMDTVRRTMSRASCIFANCETMRLAYETMFHKPCRTLYISAEARRLHLREDARQISYIGGLGLGRAEQLAAIGRALKRIRTEEPRCVDVYSGAPNPEVLRLLTEENGIRFHGYLSAPEVLNVMEHSMAVIHTESFDQKLQDIVRYSISTKIAESLMYGPVLIAYGPLGIASMDYLRENQAAYLITAPERLEDGLREIIEDQGLREQILARARETARENHGMDVNPVRLRGWLGEIVEGTLS